MSSRNGTVDGAGAHDGGPAPDQAPTAPGAGSAKAAKKARRTAAWARRRAERPTPPERADLGARIAGHAVPLLDALPEGATVLSYESWPVEPPTGPLNDALAARGVRVLVPITLPDLDLDWRPIGTPDDPAEGLGHAVLTDVDLVLAPGTLVDRAGTRLGQGGGCYDRTLPRLRPGTPVVTVLFDGELTDDPLPRDPHDVPVDAVLAPSGLTRLRD